MSRHADILEVRADDSELGQFVFYPKSGESNTFDPGGIRTEDDATGVAGNGEPIWKVRAYYEQCFVLNGSYGRY